MKSVICVVVLALAAVLLTIPVQAANSGAVITAPPVVATPWSNQGGANNVAQVQGKVMLDDQPVAGAKIAVAGYVVPQLTDANGTFTFPADRNSVRRYPVRVVDVSQAKAGANALTSQQQDALKAAEGSIEVHYAIQNVKVTKQSDGSFAVSGTVSFANNDAPPPVVLFAFRLQGMVTDANGKPVTDATVVIRSPGRDWAASRKTDQNGRYSTFFWPTADEGWRVIVVRGDQVYQAPDNTTYTFPALSSASFDVKLNADGSTFTANQPKAIAGIIYDGVLVGVAANGNPVKPISATWPDERGQFSLVLPGSLAGQTVSWWEQPGAYFSPAEAKPGGSVDLTEYPTTLAPNVPSHFATLALQQ